MMADEASREGDASKAARFNESAELLSQEMSEDDRERVFARSLKAMHTLAEKD